MEKVVKVKARNGKKREHFANYEEYVEEEKEEKTLE